MNASDRLLPVKHQLTIRAVEFLLIVCKSQMKGTDPELVIAYSEQALLLQRQIESVRRDGSPPRLTDKPEAAVMAASAGGRQ